jgi:hypothetical protein
MQRAGGGGGGGGVCVCVWGGGGGGGGVCVENATETNNETMCGRGSRRSFTPFKAKFVGSHLKRDEIGHSLNQLHNQETLMIPEASAAYCGSKQGLRVNAF